MLKSMAIQPLDVISVLESLLCVNGDLNTDFVRNLFDYLLILSINVLTIDTGHQSFASWNILVLPFMYDGIY